MTYKDFLKQAKLIGDGGLCEVSIDGRVDTQVKNLNDYIKNNDYMKKEEKILMKFTIGGELTDLNTYINLERSNRYGAAASKKRDIRTIMQWIMAGKLKPISKPVAIYYRFYCKNKRKDKDNIASWARKLIQDALVEARILPNDGWKEIIGYDERFFVDKYNPRVEVEISSV